LVQKEKEGGTNRKKGGRRSHRKGPGHGYEEGPAIKKKRGADRSKKVNVVARRGNREILKRKTSQKNKQVGTATLAANR